MELQEKINKRIQELEEDLANLNETWNKELAFGEVSKLYTISAELTVVETCIKELKQLLNN